MTIQSENTHWPQVSVVILNWNQAELTIDCLKSVYAQDYDNFFVIVVDNGSTDRSPELIQKQFPQVEMILNDHNVGYSKGNNIGIEQAIQKDADYVFLLNNDTEVDPAMLISLVNAAESDPKIGLIGPKMFYADKTDLVWCGDSYIDWKHASFQRHRTDDEMASRLEPKEVDFIDSCAILIRRTVLERIGSLNEDYFINFDDYDFNMRVKKTGNKIIHVPYANMWHKVSATMGQASPATTYYYTRNSLLFFATHAPGIWKFIAPLLVVIDTARTVGAWMVRPKFREEIFRKKRAANLLALRDFALKRFGEMGPDVSEVCFGREE